MTNRLTLSLRAAVSEQPDSLLSHFTEVFSQPSISPNSEHHGLRTSPAIDLETGFDLGTDEGQARCLRIFAMYCLLPDSAYESEPQEGLPSLAAEVLRGLEALAIWPAPL